MTELLRECFRLNRPVSSRRGPEKEALTLWLLNRSTRCGRRMYAIISDDGHTVAARNHRRGACASQLEDGVSYGLPAGLRSQARSATIVFRKSVVREQARLHQHSRRSHSNNLGAEMCAASSYAKRCAFFAALDLVIDKDPAMKKVLQHDKRSMAKIIKEACGPSSTRSLETTQEASMATLRTSWC